jgi:23S rRNA (pseudouridine1915-N3)-methyltransferase
MPLFPAHIQVVAVGRLQTHYWQAAQEEYQKRLARYTHFRLLQVKDAVGKGLPDTLAVQKEGELLLQGASGAARLIILTPEGAQMTSPQLAVFLQKQVEVYGRIAFLIGGPLGFSAEVLAAGHEQLALSAFTFPHELARVILLEQLYRAFTILNNEKYHK